MTRLQRIAHQERQQDRRYGDDDVGRMFPCVIQHPFEIEREQDHQPDLDFIEHGFPQMKAAIDHGLQVGVNSRRVI